MPLTRIQSLGITDGTIVNADINASAGIASTKLSGVTSEVKAWVNFDGTGTPAIRASLNVSSITDNGTGDYTINFTNALTDANYSVAGNGAYGTSLDAGQYARFQTLCSQTLSSSLFRIRTFLGSNTNTAEDLAIVTLMVTR